MKPIEQVIRQMDEEGRVVFQGTLIAGYSPRQALFNAFGMCERGDEIDVSPLGFFDVTKSFIDQKLAHLFLSIPDNEIEEMFWSVVENEGH